MHERLATRIDKLQSVGGPGAFRGCRMVSQLSDLEHILNAPRLNEMLVSLLGRWYVVLLRAAAGLPRSVACVGRAGY